MKRPATAWMVIGTTLGLCWAYAGWQIVCLGNRGFQPLSESILLAKGQTVTKSFRVGKTSAYTIWLGCAWPTGNREEFYGRFTQKPLPIDFRLSDREGTLLDGTLRRSTRATTACSTANVRRALFSRKLHRGREYQFLLTATEDIELLAGRDLSVLAELRLGERDALLMGFRVLLLTTPVVLVLAAGHALSRLSMGTRSRTSPMHGTS